MLGRRYVDSNPAPEVGSEYFQSSRKGCNIPQPDLTPMCLVRLALMCEPTGLSGEAGNFIQIPHSTSPHHRHRLIASAMGVATRADALIGRAAEISEVRKGP